MDPSLYQTLVFLFGIAFQQYLGYDTTPPVEAVKLEVRAAFGRGERYKFPIQPPEIKIIPHSELQKKGGCTGHDCGLLGWYSFGAGEKTIYISDRFSVDDIYTDPYVQSIIIHEDTHYLQDLYGAPRATCPEQWQIERDAYNTQFKYLAMKHYANEVVLPSISAWCGTQK